ncbi:MAG: PA2778 family cysteine peptidase [Paraglaciecola chathamensis]
MFYNVKAGVLVSLLFLLCACQSAPQTEQLFAQQNDFTTKHLIKDVPFYPQQAFYCGPTTLAEVFNYYGANTTPEQIAPSLFVPELEGSLQLEMVSASRQQGMLAYAQKGDLQQLLGLIRDDVPVVVLQNVSVALIPMWHYALVIGYDLDTREMILHTGETQNHRLNFTTFERTWARGEYWLLAAVPPDKMSDEFTPLNYTQAAQDLLSTGQKKAGREALKSAITEWPDKWLNYFLLANDYLENDPQQAALWYQKGYPYRQGNAEKQDDENLPYLNNYAYALATLGCDPQANVLINRALAYEPQNANLLDTKQQIAELSRNATENSHKAATQCPLIR